MLSRRTFLLSSACAVVLGASGRYGAASGSERFPISLSKAEWKRRLTAEQYAVLREEATEPAWSSPLNAETRPGLYHCAGCDQPIYSSEAKFDSGTGWPSFHSSLPGAVGTRSDRKLIFILRTEVHCGRCGGHLGHIFDDGPPPTGQRHCLNGLALWFAPTQA